MNEAKRGKISREQVRSERFAQKNGNFQKISKKILFFLQREPLFLGETLDYNEKLCYNKRKFIPVHFVHGIKKAEKITKNVKKDEVCYDWKEQWYAGDAGR